MAIITRAAALTTPTSLGGFAPALGAPGYTARWDAEDIVGSADNVDVPLATQWKSRVSDDVWWVTQANLTTGLPVTRIRNGRKYVSAGAGNPRGFSSRTQLDPQPDFTVALTLNPLTNTETRYFYKNGGFILGVTGGTGWLLGTRSPGQAPSIKATTSGGASTITDVHYYATPEDRAAGAGALFDMVRSGRITPRVDQRYALKDAAHAHHDLEARATTGSTVLIP